MVTGWGSHADRRDDRADNSAGQITGRADFAVPTARTPDLGQGYAEPGSTLGAAEPAEQGEWEEFVRHHIADVWSHANAEGLSQADAMDVCELVWRNAAQRLPALVASVDPRTALLTDVRREARRIQRLRSVDLTGVGAVPHVNGTRPRTIRLEDVGSVTDLAADAGAGSARISDAR